jgi:hypothetical protein
VQQQEEIRELTASLKEQAAQLRKVSAEVQESRVSQQVAGNGD